MLDPEALVRVAQAVRATMGLAARHTVDREAPSIGVLVARPTTAREVRHILALAVHATQAPVAPAIQGLVAQEKTVLRYADNTYHYAHPDLRKKPCRLVSFTLDSKVR